MRRSNLKSRAKERRKIKEIANPKSSIIEADDEIIEKLMSKIPYTKEDISKIAKSLLQQYQQNPNKQLSIFENVTDFDFDQMSRKPLFFIFGKSKNRWVLFSIIWTENERRILYKDSSGTEIPWNLKQKISEKVPEIQIIEHQTGNHGVNLDYLYGPLCLRNLNILLEELRNGMEYLVKNFTRIQFFSSENLTRGKFQKLINMTHELSKNKEFIISLKEFIDNLPAELVSDLAKYRQIVEEESKKSEVDIDTSKIKEAKKKYFKEENITKLCENYKINIKNIEGEINGYDLKIQEKFPEESRQLRNIFVTLNDIEVNQEFYTVLEDISSILNIDYNAVKLLYIIREKKQTPEEDHKRIKLTCEDINDITNKLTTRSLKPQTDLTSLDELLQETTLGIDPEDASTPKHSPQSIEDLKRKYDLVKNKYENWKNEDLITISAWAKNIRNNLGSSDEVICETTAIMDRVFNLITGGFRLRDPQILAVLIFFSGNQGRLCQIQTGEGKTVIVSLLAVIRVLQGYTVDVITSNPVLADDGVRETKTFYSVFGVTVSTNNMGDNLGNSFKIGYSADVLYGTISNFQFDFLRDSFEGFNLRSNRKFGQVILDEVDSMLIDNGGHIAKLASPYPGMECLRYIYIKIWQELQKAEESFVQETQNKIKEIFEKHQDKEKARQKYQEYLDETMKNERRIIKEKIRASNPLDIPLVPGHLKEYAKDKLETWIRNALHAKYNCHEHQQYRIITGESGEEIVVPVDYLNTGVTLKNTIWSNGLHQFVQLKHNLHLTFESLTSSFISNIGYIKNYDDKLIFGMTGTLGSTAEQKLLSNIYIIDFAKLPPYKKKIFEEVPGTILEDSSWHLQLTVEVLQKIDEDRAVLVICETEQDLLTIQKNLEILQNKNTYEIREDKTILVFCKTDQDVLTVENKLDMLQYEKNGKDEKKKFEIREDRTVLVFYETGLDLLTIQTNLEDLGHKKRKFKIRIYANEHNVSATKSRADIGDIIIATNIAGRGTNFKTTKALEEKGGLHVCVAFLPCNQRVEGQAFGRTSRQGNKGTAQLIIRRSEIDELGISEKNPSFAEIKQARDRFESKRLEHIKKVLVKELNFKDQLFKEFSKLHRSLKKEKNTIEYNIVLEDLKEFWAFWLERKDFKGDTLGDRTPQEEYKNFMGEAQTIVQGKIQHNPFYCIKLAEYYLSFDNRGKAEELLLQALNMYPTNKNILTGAHLKKFEIAIANGEEVLKRIATALAKLFFIPINIRGDYKERALEHLKNAKAAIKIEIDYIQENLINDNNFNKIIIRQTKKNPFLLHLNSRLYSLKVHDGNIDHLIEDLRKLQAVDFQGKSTTTLENLSKIIIDQNLKETIKSSEVDELHAAGINTIYTLKEIYDVSDIVIHVVQAQILGAIALFSIGLFFSPAAPITTPIAVTLVCESIIDLVMDIIRPSDIDFNPKEFAISKGVSYGMSILTLGISAIVQLTNLVTKLADWCRRFSAFLARSPRLKHLSNFLSKQVARVGHKFEKFAETIRFNKLSKLEQLEELSNLQKSGQLDKLKTLGGVKRLTELKNLENLGRLRELRKTELLVGFVKTTAWNTGKKVTMTIIEQKAIKPLAKMLLQEFLEKTRENLKRKLGEEIRKNEDLKEKLRTTSKKDINKAVTNFGKIDAGKDFAKRMSFALLGKLNNFLVDIFIFLYDVTTMALQIANYSTLSALYLQETLKGGNEDNNVDEVIDSICDRFAYKTFELFYAICRRPFSAFKKIFKETYHNSKQVKDDEEPEKQQEDILLRTDSISEIVKTLRVEKLKLRLNQDPEDTDTAHQLQKIDTALQLSESNMIIPKGFFSE